MEKRTQATQRSVTRMTIPILLLVNLLLLCSCTSPKAVAAPALPTDAVVSYLGPAGTYTEQAAERLFPQGAALQPRETVSDAVRDVLNDVADFAVIPQENTIGGPVYDYLDELLSHEELFVVGEVELPIRQALLASPGTDLAAIQTVYSHKQGIAQGKDWLQINLPNAQVVEVSSTAEGARLAADCNDGTAAAIASTQAAKVYGLEVLAENIQLNDSNVTRFYLVSDEYIPIEAPDRMTFSAMGPAQALPDLLKAMDEQGLTLVSLHDRPAKTTLGQYVYLVECSGGGQKAYEQLVRKCGALTLRCLGCYHVTAGE
ncbi:MAG: prephenate dehydratase [Faecalibacterium sp.]